MNICLHNTELFICRIVSITSTTDPMAFFQAWEDAGGRLIVIWNLETKTSPGISEVTSSPPALRCSTS